jgi:hypothetical protein
MKIDDWGSYTVSKSEAISPNECDNIHERPVTSRWDDPVTDRQRPAAWTGAAKPGASSGERRAAVGRPMLFQALFALSNAKSAPFL